MSLRDEAAVDVQAGRAGEERGGGLEVTNLRVERRAVAFSKIEGALEKLYGDARRRATLGLQRYGESESAKRLPITCPYSWDEICEQDWYPDAPEHDPQTEAR